MKSPFRRRLGDDLFFEHLPPNKSKNVSSVQRHGPQKDIDTLISEPPETKITKYKTQVVSKKPLRDKNWCPKLWFSTEVNYRREDSESW